MVDASTTLAAGFTVNQTNTSTTLLGGFAVRQIYPLWTNRRIINGVVPLNESLM